MVPPWFDSGLKHSICPRVARAARRDVHSLPRHFRERPHDPARVATLAFLLAHYVSNTPLRPSLVRAVGENGYLADYSVLAFATLAWMIHAYPLAGYVHLWPKLRLVPALVMPVACILVVLGVASRNPTAVKHEGALRGEAPAHGIVRVTRHPVMWGFKIQLDDRVNKINELLDSYEAKIGLPEFGSYSEDIGQYLQMSKAQLEALSPNMCAEISVMLVSYAFYILRALNRETAILNWAKKNLSYSAAPKAKQYKGSFSQQEAQAVMEDGYCKKLLTLVNKVEQRSDRLQFLSNNIKSIAEQLNRLQQAKMARV